MSYSSSPLSPPPRETEGAPRLVARVKTVQEWMSQAVDAVKELKDFPKILASLSPWAEAGFEATKEALPPIRFVVKLFEELTKIEEPEALARLACTVAYQSATERAFSMAGGPQENAIHGEIANYVQTETSDFSSFTLDQAVAHPFVRQSDRVVVFFAEKAHYSRPQAQQIVTTIHDIFPDELTALLANRATKEKFEPLNRWLHLDPEGRAARAALRRHSEYMEWVFRDAPVLEYEAYALSDIYIETECGHLVYSDLSGNPGRDPFSETYNSGGRYRLLSLVMNYIGDPNFRDAIIVQGAAGSGKSSFTIALSSVLRQVGLIPIRIRLRDVNLRQGFLQGLGDAIALEDDNYLLRHDRWPTAKNILPAAATFDDEVTYGDRSARICPYVLVLDGWDEISIAVSEGFKQRVKDLLMNIRTWLLGSRGPVVRIILTGRPSDAIDECADFFLEKTPILTMRPLRPEQLLSYANRIREAIEKARIAPGQPSVWMMPSETDLQPVIDEYKRQFSSGAAVETQSRRRDMAARRSHASLVLGTPFLAQLAFRLISEWRQDKTDLVRNQTTLLRSLIDLVTKEADRPSDRSSHTRILPRISGEDLRVLLRRTAEAITAYGDESIPKAELQYRLKTNDLAPRVRALTQEQVLSGLIVSFYFKGGNEALGCEFTHKALREYLFAEAIVETLKEFSKCGFSGLGRAPYWKSFESTDSRDRLTRSLAALLAPHWLTPEVVSHIEVLIEWELQHATAEDGKGRSGQANFLSFASWIGIRDCLAESWRWWAEGIHMRPQPKRDENTAQVVWEPALVNQIVPRCARLDLHASADLPEPVRYCTLDAHLGDGLLRLCSWVHHLVNVRITAESIDRSDSSATAGSYAGKQARFTPGNSQPEYFRWYLHRINGAGWYPSYECPSAVLLSGVNLSGDDLSGVNFSDAILESADLTGSNLTRAEMQRAELCKANLCGARLAWTNLEGASLSDAKLRDVRADHTNLSGAVLRNADLTNAVLSTAIGLTQEQLDSANGGIFTYLPKRLANGKEPSLPDHWRWVR